MEQMKRYSEMSEFELHREISQLNEKARKAEQMGMVNELAVYERKIAMAKAYLIDPSNFHPDETYEIKDDPGETFKISYLNGTFAWGHRSGNPKLEALPVSMLGNKVE